MIEDHQSHLSNPPGAGSVQRLDHSYLPVFVWSVESKVSLTFLLFSNQSFYLSFSITQYFDELLFFFESVNTELFYT